VDSALVAVASLQKVDEEGLLKVGEEYIYIYMEL
jgi:hypothetical protein